MWVLPESTLKNIVITCCKKLSCFLITQMQIWSCTTEASGSVMKLSGCWSCELLVCAKMCSCCIPWGWETEFSLGLGRLFQGQVREEALIWLVTLGSPPSLLNTSAACGDRFPSLLPKSLWVCGVGAFFGPISGITDEFLLLEHFLTKGQLIHYSLVSVWVY